MIKPILHGVAFQSSDTMFSFSPFHTMKNNEIVFDSYEQKWWTGGAWCWELQTRTHEYFDSVDEFYNTPEIKNWLNEI